MAPTVASRWTIKEAKSGGLRAAGRALKSLEALAWLASVA